MHRFFYSGCVLMMAQGCYYRSIKKLKLTDSREHRRMGKLALHNNFTALSSALA